MEKVEKTEHGVRLQLSDKTTLEADHVLLATGYRADIKRLPMLSPSLLATVETYMDAPILNSNFESSVPGLHFVGFSAARSAGPFYRFVVGTRASAVRVAASIERSVAQRK